MDSPHILIKFDHESIIIKEMINLKKKYLPLAIITT